MTCYRFDSNATFLFLTKNHPVNYLKREKCNRPDDYAVKKLFILDSVLNVLVVSDAVTLRRNHKYSIKYAKKKRFTSKLSNVNCHQFSTDFNIR